MKISFFGTDQFAAELLKKFTGTKCEPDLVITQPDKSAGRGQKSAPVPVREICYSLKRCKVIQPKKLNSEKFLTRYKKEAPDLALVCDYGKIIPKTIITQPTYGTLGVHPSLLPKFRGPTPIQTAILEGVKKTGVTLFLIDNKIDHGPILDQKEIPVARPTYEPLKSRLVSVASGFAPKAVKAWLGHDVMAKPQIEKKATFTEKFRKEDAKIDWRKDAQMIDRKIRALSTDVGTFTFFKKDGSRSRLKILEARISDIELRDAQKQKKPGTIFNIKGRMIVKTKAGCLDLTELQPENKSPMSGKDFLNGYQNIEKLITH